jgi:DNA polymerase elongation subunit (family B)
MSTLYDSQFAVDIVPTEDSLKIISPGGIVKSYSYEDHPEWSPFVPVESNNAKAVRFRELGTDREIGVGWKHYKTYSSFKEEERKSDIAYLRNLISYGQECLPNTSVPGMLKVMCFDFEMRTAGAMPNPDKDPIIAFGYVMLHKRWKDPDPKNNDIVINISRNEKKLLLDFINAVVEEDPDIIAGFFSKEFDIPYFLQRCNKYKIDLSILNRVNYRLRPSDKIEAGFFITKTNETIYSRTGETLGAGRVHDDIYLNSVKRDTSIKSKNRRLKTVAEFYGLDHIYDIDAEDKAHMDNISEEKMHKYLTSDIRCTAYLEEKYLPLSIALSQTLQWPMEMAVNRSPGMLSDIYCAMEAYKKDYISIRDNGQKFPKIYELIAASKNNKFEGAYNFAKEYSYSKEVQKLDVSSLYPSLMIQFNLSPDTTTLVEMIDVKDRRFLQPEDDIRYAIGFKQETDHRIYSIPDYSINKRLIVKVKESQGIIKDMLINFLGKREEKKKKMKLAEGIEKQLLDTQQNIFKILSNSIYGSMSGHMFRNTSPIIGIFVTAAGRETASNIHKAYKDQIMAIDTDGFMFNNQMIREGEINKFIEKFIKSKYGFKECFIKVKEEMPAEGRNNIIIFKKKNYALHVEGHVKLVGNSLHSSTLPGFVDQMTNEIVEKCLEDINTNQFEKKKLNSYYNQCLERINGLDPKEFGLTMAVKQEVDDYKGSSRPSLRISYINMSNETLEVKRSQISAHIVMQITNLFGNSDADNQRSIDSKWKKVKALTKYDDFYREAMNLCMLYLDNEGSWSYPQAVKLLDKYFSQYKRYPTVGDAIEYFYSNDENRVDLMENLKDRTQINISRYTDFISNVYNSLLKCCEEKEETFESIEL